MNGLFVVIPKVVVVVSLMFYLRDAPFEWAKESQFLRNFSKVFVHSSSVFINSGKVTLNVHFI